MLNSFFPVFTPFEQKLLEEIVKKLPEDQSVIFKEHLRSVNYIQRNGGDRQITFFKYWLYKMIWLREHYFQPKQGDHNLLRFTVSFDSGETLNGKIVISDGVLLGINFGGYADDYRKRTDFSVKVRTHF